MKIYVALDGTIFSSVEEARAEHPVVLKFKVTKKRALKVSCIFDDRIFNIRAKIQPGWAGTDDVTHERLYDSVLGAIKPLKLKKLPGGLKLVLRSLSEEYAEKKPKKKNFLARTVEYQCKSIAELAEKELNGDFSV